MYLGELEGFYMDLDSVVSDSVPAGSSKINCNLSCYYRQVHMHIRKGKVYSKKMKININTTFLRRTLALNALTRYRKKEKNNLLSWHLTWRAQNKLEGTFLSQEKGNKEIKKTFDTLRVAAVSCQDLLSSNNNTLTNTHCTRQSFYNNNSKVVFLFVPFLFLAWIFMYKRTFF